MMLENVDCVSLYVEDLEEGLAFYRDALGLKLLWRAGESCGLGLEQGITEVVLVKQHNPMVDFKVKSVEEALPAFLAAGGVLEYGPFPIDIGQCAVAPDKWGNRYCLLDMTKGQYTVDEGGNVTGVQ